MLSVKEIIKMSFKKMEQNSAHLKYEGCNFFRQRLVLSTLSGRPVTISNIRSKEQDPGVKGLI